jgi:hypothetical protein
MMLGAKVMGRLVRTGRKVRQTIYNYIQRYPELHDVPLESPTDLSDVAEVQAVCGKAARTVLCGGRAMKCTSLPLRDAVPIGLR